MTNNASEAGRGLPTPQHVGLPKRLRNCLHDWYATQLSDAQLGILLTESADVIEKLQVEVRSEIECRDAVMAQRDALLAERDTLYADLVRYRVGACAQLPLNADQARAMIAVAQLWLAQNP